MSKITGTHLIALFLVLFLLISAYVINTTRDFKSKMTSVESNLVTEIQTQKKHISRLKAGISQDNVRRRNIITAENIIHRVNSKLSYETRLEYATYIVDEVEKMPSVDLALALAIATAESNFNPHAESYIHMPDGTKKVNAVGIFQIVNRTGSGIARELGIPYGDSTRYDPRINCKMGIYYIQSLIDEYNNNIEMALAHYADGYLGSGSWSAHKINMNKESYKERTKEDLEAELESMVIGHDDETLAVQYTDIIKADKLKRMILGKSLPIQSKNYVPKVIALRERFLIYIADSDVYLTPSNNPVIKVEK